MLGTDASSQGGVPEPTSNPTPAPMPNTGTNSQNPNNMQCIPENVDFQTPVTASEPRPTVPIHREDGPENRNNVASKCEEYKWNKKNLKLDGDGNFLDPDFFMPGEVHYIVHVRYEKAWPTWEDVPSSQRDLLYEDFKEHYYWLPEDERQIKQKFETELKSWLDVGPYDSDSEYEYEYEEEFKDKCEGDNSNKIFLNPKDENVCDPYMDVGMDVDYIIHMTYKDKPWPKWVDVPQSQRDLWHEKLKEYYNWFSENETQMKKHFMKALQRCLQLKAKYNARTINPVGMNEFLKELYTDLDTGKRPMDYEVDGIVSARGTEALMKSVHLLQNRPFAYTLIRKFFKEIKVMGNFEFDSFKQMHKEVAEKEGMEAYSRLLAAKEAEHNKEWMRKKRALKLLSEAFMAHRARWSARDENDSVDEWQEQKHALEKLWKLLKIKLQCYQGEENDDDLFSDSEPWPTWKVVLPSQCDLWYVNLKVTGFMKLYCWLPEKGTQLMKYFETEIKWRAEKGGRLDFDEECREFEDEEGIEENSKKAFLTLAFLQNYSEYCEVMRKVEDILNSNHACWPAWEDVSRYHLDLWYKDFKYYYYWHPMDESLIRQAFEKCTSVCIDVYEKIFQRDNLGKTFFKYTFFEGSSDRTEGLRNIVRTVLDILDTVYITREYWPTWETVSPPQLDLWYEEFKEYNCCLPTLDSEMRFLFELALEEALMKRISDSLKKEYKAMFLEYEEGKKPIEYKEKNIEEYEQMWLDPPQ